MDDHLTVKIKPAKYDCTVPNGCEGARLYMYICTFVSHDAGSNPCLALTTLFPFLLGYLLLCSMLTMAFSLTLSGTVLSLFSIDLHIARLKAGSNENTRTLLLPSHI